MGRASTSKKIQRVQQAGVRKTQSSRRPSAFVLLCLAIIIVGSLAVAVARKSKVDAQVLAPVANQDQWYAAFGVYNCDQYLDALTNVADAKSGIGAGKAGLISIAPTEGASAGRNAKFSFFADATGLELTDNSFTAHGKTYKAGDACDTGKKKTTDTEVVLYSWPPQASDKVAPTILRGSAMNDFRFVEDRAIMAVALVPKGTKTIPLPPSIDALANPSDTSSASTTVVTPTSTPAAVVTPSTTAAPTTTAKGK